jgi:hypothetical protein
MAQKKIHADCCKNAKSNLQGGLTVLGVKDKALPRDKGVYLAGPRRTGRWSENDSPELLPDICPTQGMLHYCLPECPVEPLQSRLS